MLGFKRPKTHVALTARIIDAMTGEVIASLTGTGVSRKGGSILIGGVSGGVGVALALGRARSVHRHLAKRRSARSTLWFGMSSQSRVD